MSIRMLQKAREEGISKIILTPHYKPMHRKLDTGIVKRAFEELKGKAAQENIPVKLYIGNEIYYSSETVKMLQKGKAFTLADTVYVLVEFNPAEDFAYIRDGAYNLLSEGYCPILAHVERYLCLMDKKAKVDELAAKGCCLQINASSITGENGRSSRQDVKWLLKNGYVHFVASDAHDDSGRPPRLAQAAAYVGRHYGERYCEQIFRSNGEKLLAGGYL